MGVQKDSGYAWVVLLSSMVINFMCIGFCFGIISVLTYEYQVEFGADLTQVSWIGSALIAVLLVSGPVAAIFIGKLGVRTMAIVSTIVHIAGFLSSAFVTSWWQVIPTFSFISGLASCCSHICTMKILTVYFDRHQHMAYAASAMGSDAAAIAFPLITTEILKSLSYRDTILVLSATLAIAVPCAITFKGAQGPSCCRKKKKESVGTEEQRITDQNGNGPLLRKDTSESPQAVTSNGHANHDESDLNQNEVGSVKLLSHSTDIEIQHELAEDHNEEHHSLMEHINLLIKAPVATFIANAFLWNIGGAVTSVITYTYCQENDYSETDASLVMTVYGIGSFIGSLLLTIGSWWSNHTKKHINRYYFHSFCNLIMVISTFIIPFVIKSKIGVNVSIFFLGAGYGALCANLGSVIEHLNGSHLLYLVYGYEMAAAGVASLIGPVAGAQLEKHAGSGTSFYFAGACMLGAFILYVVYALVYRPILTPYSDRHKTPVSTNGQLPNGGESKL